MGNQCATTKECFGTTSATEEWIDLGEDESAPTGAAGRSERPGLSGTCQELCGGRHYGMRGKFYVHEDEDSYRAWLDHALKEQESHSADETGASPVK